MSTVLKGLLHMFVTVAATTATSHIVSGGALTSGNVLIPALIAGVFAVGHAAFPSIINDPNANAPASTPTSNFPGTR